ncbi:luciferase family protein [Mycobacteroides abscessus subsp. abscessus]|nr:luciferase family protein [Mycobacteroides abscessus subsp. abscessus]
MVEKIESYRAIGVTRLYLQMLDLDDLDHLELVSSAVAPQL